MGITNDAKTMNGCSDASSYSSYQVVNGNGIAEKAIRACKDDAHVQTVINFNPGPAKIAPSVSFIYL